MLLEEINTSTSYATTQQDFLATCGMPATETDANGNVTTYALLANRCLIQTMTQPAVDDGRDSDPSLVHPATGYTWNEFGQLLTRTDPTGRVTTNAYNATTHYLSSVTAPGGALTQFGRDTAGDITSVTDPRNYVHHGTYDTSRRLTRYDGPSGTNAATEWHYDHDGLVDYTRQATELAAPNDWATTSYTYWPTGRVRTMTNPVGAITEYSYDALNRPDCTATRMNPAVYNALTGAACALTTQGADGPDHITQLVYDAEGHVVQEKRGVGTSDLITYATRAWTANGQLDWVEDANSNRSDLVYDGFDRLSRLIFPSTNVVHTANANDHEDYSYDPNSNRVSVTLRSGETIRFHYDALNRQCFKDLPTLVANPDTACGAQISGAGAADVFTGYDLAGRRVYARYPGSFAYDTACATSYLGVDNCY